MARLVLGLSLAIGLAAPQPTSADPGTFVYQTKGLDSACAPSSAQMDAFWNGTPYWHWYIYVGGANRYCKTNAYLTAGWVDTNGPPKWGLLPIWVGLQAPCTPTGKYYVFSLTTSTAYQQGAAEAQGAYDAIRKLGFLDDVPIVLDLEAFDTSKASCVAAARSFVQGWVDWLHRTPAQKAGVYGSSCGSALDSYATIARPPDWIWGAYWNGKPSTSNLLCVGSTHWSNHQRHKQYRGGHSETQNGITLQVDSDCANGPMYASRSVLMEPACL